MYLHIYLHRDRLPDDTQHNLSYRSTPQTAGELPALHQKWRRFSRSSVFWSVVVIVIVVVVIIIITTSTTLAVSFCISIFVVGYTR